MQTKVLVVDDDELRNFLSEALEGLGYSVDIAGGVMDALSLIDADVYQLIITDKNMPGLSGNHEGGFDIARYSRKHVPRPKVIMMTGDVTFKADNALRTSVLSDYILKPFSITALKAKIDHVLDN